MINVCPDRGAYSVDKEIDPAGPFAICPHFGHRDHSKGEVGMSLELFVNGTLMRGLALHRNLDGAEFLEEARTAPVYRLYSIDDIHPGMFEVDGGGVAVTSELYRVPPDVLSRVQAGEPPDLYLGTVRLADGRVVVGILYPRELAEDHHRDISAFGDWRDYIKTGMRSNPVEKA